jgi:DNA helicase-2/ATP-dependent DNA helicase PcrA
LREFRGSALYAVPSMFLDELPEDAVKTLDLSGQGARAIDQWRDGSQAAVSGWADAGVVIRPSSTPVRDAKPIVGEADRGFTAGMIVRHENYGNGRVMDVSGHGALRKIKVRFGSGERTFLADKAKLEIIRK